MPATNSSKRSTTLGFARETRASGDVSTGKSIRNVGRWSSGCTRCENSSSSMPPAPVPWRGCRFSRETCFESTRSSSVCTLSPSFSLTASSIETRGHGGVQSSVRPSQRLASEPHAWRTASASSPSVSAIMSCTSANAW